MATFIISPRGPGLSDITCSLGENTTSNFQVGPETIDMNEPARLEVIYQQGEIGGFVRKSRRGLVPIKFTIAVFGSTQVACMANYRQLLEAITNEEGGTIEYKPLGFDSAISSYYHYLQSRPPTIVMNGALHDIAMQTYQQINRAAGDFVIICDVELQTKAWVTSDPETYVTIETATAINNEGTSLVIDSGDIKGLAAQAVLQVNGTMTSSDDVLRDLIIYKKKMRTTDNSQLEWIEAEDMEDPFGGNYDYQMFCAIVWGVDEAYDGYPVDIVDNSWDGATIIGGGDMQSDGDDCRVFNGGAEIDRWLQDINSATAQVWVNLDFEACVDMTLATSIGTSDLSVVVNENISAMPSSGIIMIGTECISYSSKFDATKTFTVSERGYGNTTVASHTSSDAVYWVQHDLWIKYGYASATAPDVDDDYEPAFELDSTNTSWIYEEFGEDDGLRTAPWEQEVSNEYAYCYTGNQGANADPWVEVGVHAQLSCTARFKLHNPCGVTNANFTNGEKYYSAAAPPWDCQIQSSVNGSSWATEYSVPAPSSPDTWESWSRDEALTAGSKYVCTYAYASSTGGPREMEAADCTVTLDSTYTPAITLGTAVAAKWVEVADSDASGNAYMQIGISNSYLSVVAANTSGMDRSYVGKISPIAICRCDEGTEFDVHWVVYVNNRIASWQTSGTVELVGSAYWKCLYQFGELDFPPFPIPDHVAEADIDDYIDTLYLELTFVRTSGGGNVEVDAVCLAKSDEWISHLYNDLDTTGLQESTDDILLIDSVERITHTYDSANDVKQRWKNEGVPLTSFVLDSRYDHRIRVMGFKDLTTLKYTPTYTFSATVKGIFLTIYPFEES